MFKYLPVIALGWAQGMALAAFYITVGAEADSVLAGGAEALGLGSIMLLALFGLVAALAAWGVPFLAARDQAADESHERRRVLAHVFKLGVAERSRERTGAIVSTATDGVERAAAYRGTFLGPMIGSMTAPIIVLAMMAVCLDPVVAGWTALALPVIPVALGGFQAAFRGVSRRYRENGRLFSAKFLDAIQGLPTLRLLGAEKDHGRRLAAAAEDLRRHVMRLLAGNQLMLFAVDSLFSLAFIASVAGLTLWRIGQGHLSPGQGLALVLCGTLLLDPLDRIGQFFYIGMGGIASVKEINALLAELPAVSDPADAVPGAAAPASDQARGGPAAAAVQFQGVDFAYGDGPVVLDGMDLEVAQGERIALAGPSGAGKTTIAELLQGNLRPDRGTIRLFGEDVATRPLAWQRAQLGVLAQHTYLFTGTLRENLLVADPAADDVRLRDALAAADLASFVEELPHGLDTPVGERGLALSGGQTQRLGIARAFLKDAPILLLDEPTAHVDLASERAILAALDRLGRDKTVVAISHRRATIAGADRVVEVRR
ncbi:MAG: ABC transporter ATP-binding protein/permease [Bifidobacteriaceae bacterium]|nr:ABC transporter ATP-binding protein/permease [Bifidobacteriaceae bacterium]